MFATTLRAGEEPGITGDGTLYNEQLEIERDMIQSGFNRFWKMANSNKEVQRETGNKAVKRVLTHVIEPFVEAITEFTNDVQGGRAHRRAEVVSYFELMPVEKLAFITLKICLDGISSMRRLTEVAKSIGEALEREYNFNIFEEVEGNLFHKVVESKKHTPSVHHKSYALKHSMNKFNVNDGYTEFPHLDKARIGLALIDILIEKTGIFFVQTMAGGKKMSTFLTATSDTLSWIEEENRRLQFSSPVFLPMIAFPKEWSDSKNGGYYLPEARRYSVVKTNNKAYLADLDSTDMERVYEALNAIQSTAWQVNPQVVEVMTHYWQHGVPICDFPSHDEVVPPRCPLPSELKKENMSPDELAILQGWKLEAARAYNAQAKQRSHRMRVGTTLGLAERYKEKAIYFPYNLDFRGRVYSLATYLNPQGDDMAKGLLRFHQGKPLRTTNSVKWFMVSGANLFGYDKVSIEERQEWVDKHEAEILRVAEDPYEYRFWTEADNPWQFLGWCFEFAQWKSNPFEFNSHLPVALDGTCNGIQHLAAMSRNREEGASVNLTLSPTGKPMDIYQEVADKVLVKIQHFISDYKGMTFNELPEEEEEMAKLHRRFIIYEDLVKFGIDRKITKRSVMVFPYGGMFQSSQGYIMEALLDKLGSKPWESTFTYDLHKTSSELAKLVFDTINETLQNSKEVMNWLRKMSSVLSKQDLPVSWVTPLGFPVYQKYHEVREQKLFTQFFGHVPLRPLIYSETKDMDKRKQVSGIAPNFVHSMDATALMMYVLKAKREGISSYALVHDSYGTHAADTERAFTLLREAFVELYRDNDVLAQFLESARFVVTPNHWRKFPKLPTRGDLDIDEVLDSDFFFC